MWVSIYCFMLMCLSGCALFEKSSEKDTKPLVINVLDKELYDDCHIAGDVHVPFDRVEQYLRNEKKDREIVVYCSNYACTSSHYIAQKLCANGFSNISVYAGGMAEWWQHGLPTEGPATKSYLTMKMEPVVQASQTADHGCNGIKVISMQELAEKLGVVVVSIENKVAA